MATATHYVHHMVSAEPTPGSHYLTVDSSHPQHQLRHRHGAPAEQQPAYTVPLLAGLASPIYHARSARYLLMVLVSLAWVASSTTAILVNNHIMNTLNFRFPAAVAALGMIVTSIACFLVIKVFRIIPTTAPMNFQVFTSSVMPTALFLAWSYIGGNLSYLYLNIAFIQMLKALTPVSTLVTAFVFKLDKPTVPLCASVSLITVGILGASFGEINFNIFGVLVMISSVVAESLRLVLSQHLMERTQMQALEALLYVAPACAMWLLLSVTFFELKPMIEAGAHKIILGSPLMFLASATMGFGVNALAMGVLGLAGAVALKVLGICKDAGMVAVGMALFGNKVTWVQACAYAICLTGIAWYNKISTAAMAANNAKGGQLPSSKGGQLPTVKAAPLPANKV